MIKKSSFITNKLISKGRLFKETEDKNRSIYQRDRDRIIHSSAFRRLEHKTQVFVYHEGDHFRSRLTHTLEVSQIARSISRILGIEEDLSEAISLAHDLGHTPFGHAGEESLNDEMQDFGGFDHNSQTLRIITYLEKKYAGFDGLNLTWETLEGIAKHNGPISKEKTSPIIQNILNDGMDLELHTWCGPEAQVASLADDIAYCNHDIDDGIRANLFSFKDICSNVSIVDYISKKSNYNINNNNIKRIVHETIRGLISTMINDVIKETKHRIKKFHPNSVFDIRNLDIPLVSFSEPMIDNISELRLFLTKRMYKHSSVNRMTSKAKRIIKDLFNILLNEPDCLPGRWRVIAEESESIEKKARTVSDYIAGMTDRYAINEHRRLLDLNDGW